MEQETGVANLVKAYKCALQGEITPLAPRPNTEYSTRSRSHQQQCTEASNAGNASHDAFAGENTFSDHVKLVTEC